MKHMAGWGLVTFWMMTGVILSLWLSGLVMYWLPAEELPDMTPIQEGLRHACGIVHGTVSWVFCVMLGRGVWPHVRVMWHRRTRRAQWVWGTINLTMLGFLSLGGLTLLYGSPGLHEVMSSWHFWVGASLPLMYLAHTWKRFVWRRMSGHFSQ
jgi:H+/Cl- antiporter ClcA